MCHAHEQIDAGVNADNCMPAPHLSMHLPEWHLCCSGLSQQCENIHRCPSAPGCKTIVVVYRTEVLSEMRRASSLSRISLATVCQSLSVSSPLAAFMTAALHSSSATASPLLLLHSRFGAARVPEAVVQASMVPTLSLSFMSPCRARPSLLPPVKKVRLIIVGVVQCKVEALRLSVVQTSSTSLLLLLQHCLHDAFWH